VKKLFENFYHRRLSGKLVMIAVTVTVCIELVLCSITYFGTRYIAVQNAASQYSRTLEQLTDKINERLSLTLTQYNYLENNIIVRNLYNRSGDLIANSMQASSLFSDERFSNANVIDSIVFLRDDGLVFSELVQARLSYVDVTQEEWYRRCVEANGNIIWYPNYQPEFLGENRPPVVGMMKYLKNPATGAGGILMMNLRVSYLENELSQLNLGQESEVFIRNELGEFVVFPKDDAYCAKLLEYMPEEEVFRYYKSVGRDYLFVNDVVVNDWDMISVLPKGALFRDVMILSLSVLMTALSGLILSFILVSYMIRNVTNPLGQIEEKMRQVETQQIHTRIGGKLTGRKDEIGSLAKSCNAMLESIENLIHRVEQESKLKSKAELATLQNQVNSHFLYNTLESISLKIMRGEKEKSFDMIRRLAQYFRLALNNGKDIVAVRNELMHIENYIEIVKYRMKKPIFCTFDVDEELYEVEMPKLLIQPLVENSIHHGFFDSDEDVQIHISGKKQGNRMIFSVRDRGVGFSDTRMMEYIKGEGSPENCKENFALKNIYIRMQIFYKEQSDMRIYNCPDGGACVELEMPL